MPARNKNQSFVEKYFLFCYFILFYWETKGMYFLSSPVHHDYNINKNIYIYTFIRFAWVKLPDNIQTVLRLNT